MSDVKVFIESEGLSATITKQINKDDFYSVVQQINKAIETYNPIKLTETVARPLNVTQRENQVSYNYPKLVFFRCDVCGYLGFGKAEDFPHTFVCRNCHCSHTVTKKTVRYVDVNCSGCGKHSSYYVDTTVDGIKCKQCGKFLSEAEATERVD